MLHGTATYWDWRGTCAANTQRFAVDSNADPAVHRSASSTPGWRARAGAGDVPELAPRVGAPETAGTRPARRLGGGAAPGTPSREPVRAARRSVGRSSHTDAGPRSESVRPGTDTGC